MMHSTHSIARLAMIVFLSHTITTVADTHSETIPRDLAGPRETSPIDLPPDADLNDYLRLATARNPGLEAAFDRWRAEQERIRQAKALPDPHLTYGYFIESVETRVGPQRQRFGLMQTIPWFGTLNLRGDQAARSADAARQVYERTKLQLLQRVKSVYYEYWYLAQAVAVTREHVRLVTHLEGVARTRFKAGSVPHNAVIQAQVELGKLDDRLRSLEALQAPIVAKLNATLNRSPVRPLPWPRSLPEFDVSFTDEDALAWLGAANPELHRLEQLALREEAAIRLAKKSYYPDVSLGVDYIDTDDALNPAVEDSGKDAVVAMVSVNIPLWHGKYRAAEREARLRKASVEESRIDAERRLSADLMLVLYHLRDAERKVDLYGDTLVPKAKQALQVTQQGFEAGQAGFIALIDAQRSLLEFQLAHRKALSDRVSQLAVIEVLVSRDLSTATQAQQEEIPEKTPVH